MQKYKMNTMKNKINLNAGDKCLRLLAYLKKVLIEFASVKCYKLNKNR